MRIIGRFEKAFLALDACCYYVVWYEDVNGCVLREQGIGDVDGVAMMHGDGNLRLYRDVHGVRCIKVMTVGLRMGNWAASGREWECWGCVIW